MTSSKVDQFGRCTRCGETSATQPGTHNLTMIRLGREENYYQYRAYDVCDECLEYISEFLEERDSKK